QGCEQQRRETHLLLPAPCSMPAPRLVSLGLSEEGRMRMSGRYLALALAVSLPTGASSRAPGPDLALTGIVSSLEEGPMEGVVVTLKKPGSTLALSVVSGSSGRYGFPAERLEPGRYNIAIRAVGYDLNGPIAAQIGDGKTV